MDVYGKMRPASTHDPKLGCKYEKCTKFDEAKRGGVAGMR
jgi:hypothetical protein